MAANDDQIDDIDWEGLYNSDPGLYEQTRVEEIAKLLESGPPEYQLKGRQLQWKLDVIHATMPPLKATVEISSMMWDSFFELSDVLGGFDGTIKTPPEPTKPTLKIIK
jgi:hypothetical protein